MSEKFIPAAHYHFLTPVYEWMMRNFLGKTWDAMAEEVATLALQDGSATDIGCGPGTVLRRIRYQRPDLQLEGFDIDPAIVAIAKSKAQGLDIAFGCAPIDHLPLPNQSKDLVINNMVFHHLSLQTKRAALTEVKRVLKPGGSFLLCDFSILIQGEKVSSVRAFFSRLIEPEVIPQLDGQIFTLAGEAQATLTTLRTFHGCIALHLLQFPSD